ncbi:DUF6415 family natural product biosynthesis protein [Streptomyces sp. NPDC056501]|uniref:DUF6415 family natural product biosynthesis protein n=1 Tax=Streptomyces sp. NPDC056501 TaxID=3345841 RepID=UPI003699A14D
MTITPAPQARVQTDIIRALCARVLTPDTYGIPGGEVRAATTLLSGHVRLLLGESGGGTQARTDAERLLARQPGEGRLGAWIHMRALARVCRVLLIEHQVHGKRGVASSGRVSQDVNVVARQ